MNHYYFFPIPDKKLKRVRDEFVQRVSDAVINQLLDLCLKHGVLGDEEKDSILEGNRTRANKARALIDAVTRKGPETCEKVIGYLESKDRMLFKQLGLSSAQASQSAGRRKEEEEETACKRARQQDKPDGVTRSQDLSELQLLQVAEQLGKEWKQVAIYLGLESNDVDDLEEAEISVTMRKQKMLLKWKNKRKRGEATAKHLLESLKEMENLSHKVYEILEG
uniref:CARD domain-containing protein n=1 Tax=Poecilia reticulata TaxID=8081 RepID=A0A3P9MYE1_POERE